MSGLPVSRRRPGQARLPAVLLFLGLTLCVVCVALAWLYRGYRDQLDRELGQRLVAVASATSAAVDGDVWLLLSVGDPATHAETRAALDRIRRLNGVADLFLFDLTGTTLLDLSGRYPEGEPNLALTLDSPQVTSVLAGRTEYTPLASEQGVYLKAGYAPVLDPDGRVVGGVGVEASAAFLDLLAGVRRTLLGAGLGVLVALAVLGLVFARALGAQSRLESRLRRTETLATMGQMAAMLAHEIRNPLGIIRGAAERIGRRYQIEEDEVYRFIPEEVDRLEATLGAYLHFARPGGEDEAGDLAEALDRTLALVRTEFERAGVVLVTEIEEGAYPVATGAHFLQQVFLNVFLNSRDAMPDGGTLTVSLVHEGRRGRVRITDTGMGMTPEVRRRATEAFYTAKERGSGLGLAVVDRVVEEAGGRLELQSRVGEGTALTLTFPLGD